MYSNHYSEHITGIPRKGISSWSIHLKEKDVQPYIAQSFKAVEERLDEILK